MLIRNKIGWAGIALTLLTTGMYGQGSPRSPAGSDSNKEGTAVFVIKNEIKKVQETLRGKGYYGGKVDGVFGLRTRASVRAFTAAGLGVRPESKWTNSQSTGREVGRSSDIVAGEIKREKPSAGIRRAESRPNRTARKEISRAAAMEDNRGGGANKQQAENEEHDQ